MHSRPTAVVAGPCACQCAGQLGISRTGLAVTAVPDLEAAGLASRQPPVWLAIALADRTPTLLRLFHQTQDARLGGVIVIAERWLCAYRGHHGRLSRQAPRTPAELRQLPGVCPAR
jgi:hypothetical protein